jgi:parallel beta-helix repeat protein
VSGNNETSNSGDGVYLYSSSNNSITSNKIIDNSVGLQLLNYSRNNVIHHNSFIGNTVQASVNSTSTGNAWNDAYPSGGNYWSDYTARYPNATEIDNSGLWNTPYVIDSNNIDHYPLMHFGVAPLLPIGTVSITVTSSPVVGSGFVEVDDIPITTPTTFTWTVGSNHKIEALSPVAGPTGTQYVWTGWSDGGAQTHSYTVPSTNQTVTANYKTQYYLTVNTAPTGVATIRGAGWYDANSYAPVSTEQYANVTPFRSRYNFTGWTTSNMAKITNPSASSTTVLMDEPKTVTADYVKQYYLKMSTNSGTLSPGSGWFNTGSNVTISAAAPSTIAGETYLWPGWLGWLGWFGMGLGSYSGSCNPAKVTMKGPISEFAMWRGHVIRCTLGCQYISD